MSQGSRTSAAMQGQNGIFGILFALWLTASRDTDYAWEFRRKNPGVIGVSPESVQVRV
jgi:hypothetical protein